MKTLHRLYLGLGLLLTGIYEYGEWNAVVPKEDAVQVIQPSVRVPVGGSGGSSFWYSGSRGGK
ncbi:MAG: hypothetical protein ACKO32_00160 [Planctomycetia bacterium]